jgi:alpha-beta hydrolase superfamily lysophospholipase
MIATHVRLLGLRLLKKPFFGRYQRPWRWPEGAAQASYERAETTSNNGARLSLLVRTRPAARGVVLFAHPMGAAAKGFFIREGHADAFFGAGYSSVFFDFNGFGESASTTFDYPADLLAAARFARERFPGLPLAVIGASFGAMRAIEAGAQSHGLFDVMVAEAAAYSLPAFWRRYPLPHAVLTVLRWVSPESERRLRPEAMIRAFPPGKSVLLIHSHADTLTPPGHGEILAQAAPPHVHVERLVLERAGHTYGLRDEREPYLRTVLDFLERRLPGAPPGA